MHFESTLHALRYEARMKQEELAELVGVRRETIGLIERGKYNPSLLLATNIAWVFGKKVEEVFQFFPETDEERQMFENIKRRRDELQKKEVEKQEMIKILNAIAPDRP